MAAAVVTVAALPPPPSKRSRRRVAASSGGYLGAVGSFVSAVLVAMMFFGGFSSLLLGFESVMNGMEADQMGSLWLVCAGHATEQGGFYYRERKVLFRNTCHQVFIFILR